MNERMSRRELLKYAGAVAGAVAVGKTFGSLLRPEAASAAPLAQGEIVKDIPTDIALPDYISYFPDRVQVFESSRNDTDFSVVLQKGGILLVQSAELNILGSLWTINPRNNPGTTQLIDVVALTDGVNVLGQTKSGTYTRLDQEQINDVGSRDMAGLVEAARLAGEVQVGRTRIAGNCVAAGCNPTRLVRVAAYNIGKGTVYNLVSDDNYRRP